MKRDGVNMRGMQIESVQSVLPRLREMSRVPSIKTSGLVSSMRCDTYLTPDFATLGKAFDAVVCPVVVWDKPLAHGLARVLAAGDQEIRDALEKLTRPMPTDRALAVPLRASGRSLVVVETEVTAGVGLQSVHALYRRALAALEKSGAKNALVPLLGVQVGSVSDVAQVAITQAGAFSAALGVEIVFSSNQDASVDALCDELDRWSVYRRYADG